MGTDALVPRRIFPFFFFNFHQLLTITNIITGKDRRWNVPPYSGVPTTQSFDDTNRRARARQDPDGDDVANDQWQALRRRQARASRHQGLRDRFHRRQTAAAAGQAEDRLLPRQRRMITNLDLDDRQRDVNLRIPST